MKQEELKKKKWLAQWKKRQERAYPWEDRIVCNPDILGGKPIIKGTRLSVEFVTDTLCGGGITEEWFLEEHHNITREDVYACFEYAATGAKLRQHFLGRI